MTVMGASQSTRIEDEFQDLADQTGCESFIVLLLDYLHYFACIHEKRKSRKVMDSKVGVGVTAVKDLFKNQRLTPAVHCYRIFSRASVK